MASPGARGRGTHVHGVPLAGLIAPLPLARDQPAFGPADPRLASDAVQTVRKFAEAPGPSGNAQRRAGSRGPVPPFTPPSQTPPLACEAPPTPATTPTTIPGHEGPQTLPGHARRPSARASRPHTSTPPSRAGPGQPTPPPRHCPRARRGQRPEAGTPRSRPARRHTLRPQESPAAAAAAGQGQTQQPTSSSARDAGLRRPARRTR